MPTDTKLEKLIINKLTLEQYQALETIDEGQLYFVDNEADGFPAQLSGYAGYALLADGNGGTRWGEFPSLDASHTWTGEQTYTANVIVSPTYYLKCDTINSATTGNALLRMYYDADGAYKCLVGSVYRQTTLLGSADRPYYAKDGEAFQAHELALLEDVKPYRHTITISWTSGTNFLCGCFTGSSSVSTACASYDDMHAAFNGSVLAMSGCNVSGDSTAFILSVNFKGGTSEADGIAFILPTATEPDTIAFSAMTGFTITDIVD